MAAVVITCGRCGASAKALGAGSLRLIDETDVDGLRLLLLGALDTAVCQACSEPLGRTASLVTLLPSSGTALYTAGAILAGDRGALAHTDWRALLRTESAPHVIECPDAVILRDVLLTRLAERLEPVRVVARAVVCGDVAEVLSTDWRAFTPPVFAAAHLALSGDFPELQIGRFQSDDADDASLTPLVAPDRYDQEDRMAALTLVQVAVLDELCREWTDRISARQDPPVGVSLESDLRTYADTGPHRVRLALAAHALLEDQAGLSPYVLEAVRASLHAMAERPHPQGRHWADLYFAHELWARTQQPLTRAVESSRISRERARATIRFEHAWQAASTWLNTAMTGEPAELVPLAQPALLEDIARDAGHPQLMEAISQSAMRSTVTTVEAVIDELRDRAGKLVPDALVATARLHAEFLVRQSRTDDLETVGEALCACLGGGIAARARAEAWLAGALNRAHRPARVLARLGAAPQPWEAELASDLKVGLHHERASALEDSGRLAEALSIRLDVLGLLGESSSRRPWALTNLALTQLAFGRPDLALPGFNEAMSMLGPDPSLLCYMAMAHEALNERAAADVALATAQQVAPPDEARHYALLRAHRFAMGRRPEEAAELLIANVTPHRPHSPNDARNLVTEAEAWTTLLGRRVVLHQAARERVAVLPALLLDLAERAEVDGQAVLSAAALSGRAGLLEAARTDGSHDDTVREAWREAHAIRERHGLNPQGVTLLKLAFAAYLSGDMPEARKRLVQVPAAVAGDIGGVPDITKVVHEPAKLAAPLADLGGLLIDLLPDETEGPRSQERGAPQVEWPDFRLVAELQRDAAGRTAALRQLPTVTMLDEGFSDSALAQLASPQQGLVVVEWFYTRRRNAEPQTGLCSILTRIDASGDVLTYFIPQLSIDYSALAKKLRKRLFDWTPRRRGDPLDRPEWRRTEEWILHVLRSVAQPGDHVVVLQHAATADLPWHAAIGPHWSVSYASGWTALQSFLRSPEPPRGRIGVLTVPRTGEDIEVATALRASAARAAVLAPGALAPSEAACDLAAFRTVMNECDVAVLLCHGFVNPSEREVALSLSHLGKLPLANSVAASSSLGNVHRLSWRECTSLPRASRTVFSAACSSGVSHPAGLGDRLGLFGALRTAGTTAVVAPGWDVVASAVLPVLDDALSRFLAGEPLGPALRQASLAAAEHQPAWLAWALTLEGDWR
ncbi:CHAT domain-containing protein [Streptomyces sp. NPDC046862]|uniref:CHAT domain-containing protein n=1 Tax=Streptomyces sp. NPDC046862 TaxID=3154603 RepID=UPI00345548B5